MEIRRFADTTALIPGVGKAIAAALNDGITENGCAHLVLTGGTIGIAVLEGIPVETVDWSRVHLWWGDERFVEAGSLDRNCLQAQPVLLDRISIPVENVHRVPATDSGLSLDQARVAYATELQSLAVDDFVPEFDVTLLGMGPDAHIASLFPGRELDTLDHASTCAVMNSPKPPAERVSLTRAAINSSKRVWLLVADANKAECLNGVLNAQDDAMLPASCVHGTEETVLWTDDASLTVYDRA